MSLAISLFVTILVIYSGFKGVEVNQIKLARTFGASKAQILTKVILPGSIPTMIAAPRSMRVCRWSESPSVSFSRPASALATSFSTAARYSGLILS